MTDYKLRACGCKVALMIMGPVILFAGVTMIKALANGSALWAIVFLFITGIMAMFYDRTLVYHTEHRVKEKKEQDDLAAIGTDELPF